MKFITPVFLLFFVLQLDAQSSIVRTISVNPSTKDLIETTDIQINSEYLLRVEKGQVIDGQSFSVFPTNYVRLDGDGFDLLPVSYTHLTLPTTPYV